MIFFIGIAYLFSCFFIADFGAARNINRYGLAFVCVLCSPVVGMFWVLATPTIKDRELQNLMLEHYRKANTSE